MVNDKKPPVPAAQPFDRLGVVVGVILGCVAIFVLPDQGILVGMVLPMIGAVLGLLLARLISSAVKRNKE